ncbi:MAG: hypothetical protein HHAS10_00950 [Candidatus Altimarinota bacterium]
MDISSLLQSAIASGATDKIAAKLGVDNAQAKKLIALGAPLLLEKLSKNAESQEGASALYDALDKHTSAKTDIDDDDTDGQKIIGHIFGDEKETTADTIARESGVSKSQAGSALAAIAPLLLGALGEEKSKGGITLDNLSGVLSSTSKNSRSMLESLAVNLLDKNNDGDYKDDLLRMGADWLKKQFSKK